jgi:hypothetical protein
MEGRPCGAQSPANICAGEEKEEQHLEETMTRLLMALAATCLIAGGAAADTCKAESEAKKLHGAAETSFMKKCEKDATTKCEADAKEKKLHGAAETSFTKKCVKEATGA